MLAHQNTAHHYTVEEYLALEEKSEVRHEFYNGELYAMAGGTVNHNRLTRRVANLLENQSGLKKCSVYTENLRVEVIRGVYLPYPDVVVTCHPFDQRPDQTIIRQPRLLVEVLSKSTANHDRGFKWHRYRKMPSLWYYMLVDEHATTVELFSQIEKTGDWVYSFYESTDDVIVLPRLDVEIAIGAIYDDIELIPEDQEMFIDEEAAV